MKKDFIKIKCLSPEIQLGNTTFNSNLIVNEMLLASNEGVDVLALPELCICGTSLGDMLANRAILNGSIKALENVIKKTQGASVLSILGMPYAHNDEIYNIGVIVDNGIILGAVYSQDLKKISPLGHARVLSSGKDTSITILGKEIKLSDYFEVEKNGLKVGFILGSGEAMLECAPDLLINPTSLYESVTSEETLSLYTKETSKVLGCAYAVCTPGTGESSSQVIFSNHNIIAENGEIIAQALPFEDKKGECVAVISKKVSTNGGKCQGYYSFENKLRENVRLGKSPFVPENEHELNKRCKKILEMESHALARRLRASYSKTCVLGISGGLDSTLALITCVLCADLLGWDRKNVVCVTMPCFGTTNRTRNNATELCNALGVTLKEVNISEAVTVHLRDICHDIENRNVTYENAQARERTQVLMDIANDMGGIVIGTGDMSEVALGWSTFNGDHMSMYGVNSAIVKTLIRHVVAYFAKNADKRVAEILYDILDTPVSPELLPHKDGEIQQKTEDIVGPYDLHDFFIYYFVSKRLLPSEIYQLAKKEFVGAFDSDTIYKWLEIFIKRFFTQHFKRSCSPDSISLGSSSLGKYDLQMPSDMSCEAFLEDLRSVKE
ncbi:MAG: NAD(+) synthase [Clostridia bacterium]|nr:NAD(+) synthase [Clostridia bacterium]